MYISQTGQIMWTECRVIDFHEYLKISQQKAEEIQEDPWGDWWTAEMRPERAKNGPSPWTLHNDIWNTWDPNGILRMNGGSILSNIFKLIFVWFCLFNNLVHKLCPHIMYQDDFEVSRFLLLPGRCGWMWNQKTLLSLGFTKAKMWWMTGYAGITLTIGSRTD